MSKKTTIHPALNLDEQSIVEKVLADLELYKEQSQQQRQMWADCYTAYVSSLDNRNNPYLANLFVPKTHEAVEILTAFLVGSNQTIRAKPAKVGSTYKAEPIQKLLQFQWQKVLRAREKIEIWAKEAVLFGTGIMKVGWLDDPDKKLDDPFMEVVELPHFYCDFYTYDIQEQPSVIHEIFTTEDKVKKMYPESKNIELVEAPDTEPTSLSFKSVDSSVANEVKKIKLLEYWTLDKLITLVETKEGWVVLRNEENPYKTKKKRGFIPFVVCRYKLSPLPNRFYGIGAIEPTLKVQKAINNVINEMFDNITLINQKMWIKRRGASINPQDLVARPGGIIEATDINQDLKAVEVSDIKGSIQMLYNLLDAEFQQASGAVNLLKGMPGAEYATEAALQQRNVMSLLNRVVDHFRLALSELGQMLVEVNIRNITTNRVIKILEGEKEDQWMEIKPNEIDGEFDIEIQVDRVMETDRIVMSKQLVDFLAVAGRDPNVLSQIDTTKLYKRWLELQGFADVDEFFIKKPTPTPTTPIPPSEYRSYREKGRELPKREEELSRKGAMKAFMPPNV